MDKTDKKAMIAAYKEQKIAPGIYSLTCTATRSIWVGKAMDMSKIENRIRFMLANAGFVQQSIKKQLALHGSEHFAYQSLETLDDDLSPMARDTELKSRHQYWSAHLGAEKI